MKKTGINIVGDPLAKFLLNKLHFSPIKASIFIVAIAFVYDFLQFFMFGNLPGNYLEIFTTIAWHFIFIPAMAFFYLWSNNAMPNLLNDLAKAKTIELSQAEINTHLMLFNRPWRLLFSIFGGMTLGLLYLVRSSSFNSIYTNPVFLIPRQVGWFIAGYIVSILASALIINVYIINIVFKNKNIHLEPMHPDKSGGFGKLGDYSKVLAYLISSAGLVIGLTELRYFYNYFPKELWIIHLFIPIYIVGATVSFFAPILFVHWKMKLTKREMLIEIQEKIAQEYYTSKEKIVYHSENIDTDLSKIKQLQILYEITEKIPEWPFNLQALNGFLFSVFSPIFSFAFGIIGNYIKGLIAP